jgi:NAD+ synthase
LNCPEVSKHITHWLKSYVEQSGLKGFVIGISGGIDSAVTSTLCAQTEKEVLLLNLPLRQNKKEYDRASEHILDLEKRFSNVKGLEIDLSHSFDCLSQSLPGSVSEDALAMANTRSRLRMTTLYAVAQHHHCLVAGTGNKIEDFGVGFFTKYGDGGVDLSPIADLTKSEVFQLAEYLGVVTSIQNASPTDGLWSDGRTDEQQLGATYSELEWAMMFSGEVDSLNDRQKYVLEIYRKFHTQNKHKMEPIPVCLIPENIKS